MNREVVCRWSPPWHQLVLHYHARLLQGADTMSLCRFCWLGHSRQSLNTRIQGNNASYTQIEQLPLLPQGRNGYSYIP